MLGVLANKQIAQTGQNGAGMAKAGIIIGAVVIVIAVFWLFHQAVNGSGGFYYTG